MLLNAYYIIECLILIICTLQHPLFDQLFGLILDAIAKHYLYSFTLIAF